MSRSLHRRAWLAALAVLCALLSSCSGVPTSSLPQVVRTVDGTGAAVPTATVRPQAGDDSRAIVTKFLEAQVTNDKSHQSARAFLTTAAATKWQDSTVNVVDDWRVGPMSANNVISVTGRGVGTLDVNGIYTPVLTGPGASSVRPFSFGLAQTNGQWRITDPPAGLIVRARDFASSFHRRLLYFFDQAETRLVPDIRYSPLDAQSLVSWLLDQLINPQQQQSGLRNEFPDQIDPQRSKVTLGQPITVQLPGLSQADVGTVSRIAAEIAYAFQSGDQTQSITMLDGTRAVPISSGASQFTAGDFPSFNPVPSIVPQLFFLRDGVLTNDAGAPVGGRGANQVPLETVAVANVTDSDMQIAGLTSERTKVYVGTAGDGLRVVPLPGVKKAPPVPATSRPEWVMASTDEVWLGQGSVLVRIVGTTVSPIQFASSGTDLSGRTVRAVRVSPEGARIAMVLSTGSADAGSVWVGNVVRSGPSVQVEALHQVTPGGWQVRDVSWSTGGITLRAIGSEDGGAQIEIWSMWFDGSLPAEPSSDNLPSLPDWITSTTDGSTWVSADKSVWREAPLGGWTNPFSPANQVGSAPVYSLG